MKRFFTLFTIFILIMMNINVIGIYADENIEDDIGQYFVNLYEDIDLKQSIFKIKEETTVLLVDDLDEGTLHVKYYLEDDELLGLELSKIETIINSEDYSIEGYILKDDLILEQDLKEDELFIIYPVNSQDQDINSEDKVLEENGDLNNHQHSDNSLHEPSDSNEEVDNQSENDELQYKAESTFDNDGEELETDNDIEKANEQTPQFMTMSSSVPTLKTYYGIALKNVNVYLNEDTNSKVLKSYSKGSILKYKGNDGSTWYEANVKINGTYEKGYIHYKDVENSNETQSTKRGIGLKNKTHVYANASTSSKQLKSYAQGTLLKYKTFTTDWYEATVKVNGEWKSGYIHSSHVEEPISKQETLRGFGKKSPTHVYKKASTSSGSWKSYSQGSLLKYKTYTTDWYEATVKVNGKYEIGYIHKSHVEQPTSNPKTLYGIGLKSTTHVYSSTSTSSKSLKSYKLGKKLKYKSFINNWYEAQVKVNGKYETGYIHKSHVDDLEDKQETLNGFALRSQTHVYKNVSKSSGIRKSYKEGKVLKYKTYSKNWYEAQVKVNGKYQTGYIHHSDVLTLNSKRVVIDPGHGGSDPGALGNGLREKDMTLDISKKVKSALEKLGFYVLMTRDKDEFVSLENRSKFANNANADIFVSIHINAGGGTGIETYSYDKGPHPTESKKLAQYLQNEIIKETGARDRGTNNANFHVNRETKLPSSLVEVMFIDTKSDADKLKNTSFINKVVKGIVNGIAKFFQ